MQDGPMDPTLLGALIGAGATALGSVIAWIGSRAQARAQLRATTLQFKGQRLDALFEARRVAYAEFLQAVERTRAAIAPVAGVVGVHGAEDLVQERREALDVAMKEMLHQQSILRLSVTGDEAASAESLMEVVLGAISDLDAWRADSPRGPWTVHQQLLELEETVEHFVEGARGYLHAIPDLDPSREGLWQRWQGWRLERWWRRNVRN